MALVTDPDQLADSSADDASQEVYINTGTKRIKLVVVGNLSADGVTMKCLYSFLKEQWKNDPHTKNLAAFPFPLTPITDESFEFGNGWDFENDTARYLIRSAGWDVKNTSGLLTQRWSGIIGLGTIESDDQLYFQQASGGSATNVQLTGQVNQAVQVLRDDDGDGNFAEGSDFDRRTVFNLFGREYSQLYGKATLAQIGVTALSNQAYRFPISTADDLAIQDNDTDVGANSPYTQIVVRYLAAAYNREVDSSTKRNFGIVIDVGTYSQSNGASNSSTLFTSAVIGDLTLGNYTGGTLTIHEGADQGVHTISGTPVNNAGTLEITLTVALTATAGTLSFTMQRATPIVASAEQIYTKVQYLLRQNSDIDASNTGSVTGKTADPLLLFTGTALSSGSTGPTNTNSGGSGVIIEGFQSSDTNRLSFFDNSATERTYPFVAVLTLNFGANLIADASAEYWVYFTTNPGGNYGAAAAIILNDNDGNPMTGLVSAASSVQLTFDYDNNVQGGRTAGTNAAFTAVAIGLSTGQFVSTTGTISRSTANSASLVAALERNYANP